MSVQPFGERDDMTEEEAREFYEYNIAGAYVGEAGPVFMEEVDS